jgi:hypothetical protein
LAFGFRASFGLRISDFGFAFPFPGIPPGTEDFGVAFLKSAMVSLLLY